MTDTLVLGDLTEDDINELKERLHDEELVAVSGYRDRNDDLRLTAVTEHRVIGYQSTGPQVLGDTQTFKDVDLDDILDIKIQEKKAFDEFIITTEHQTHRFMIADQTGVALSGEVRKLIGDRDD